MIQKMYIWIIDQLGLQMSISSKRLSIIPMGETDIPILTPVPNSNIVYDAGFYEHDQPNYDQPSYDQPTQQGEDVMQKEFTEKCGEFYKGMSKPMTDLAELNVKTISKLMSNTNMMDDFVQAKKSEDFMAAQMKFANKASLEAIKYAQEAASIYMDMATTMGKMMSDMMRDTATQVAERQQK